MEKTLVLVKTEDKKHSVIYKPLPTEKDPFVTGVYIMRTALGPNPPSQITLTLGSVHPVTS